MNKALVCSEGSWLPSLADACVACQRSGRSEGADLLAVVVDVTFPKAPFPLSVVWLRDDSLIDYIKIAVSLSGKHSSQSVVTGDFVRLNRVRLVSNEVYSGTTIYHFRLDPVDPASMWAALGTIRDDGSFHEYTKENKALPGSMPTNSSCISRLVDWYRQQQQKRKDTTLPSLSPHYPCQFRTLSELQCTTGVVSHTRAHVMDVQRHAASSPRGRKRQRFDTKEPQTFALLRDPGEEATMTFMDEHNKWTQAFLTAQLNAQKVQFLYVQASRRGEEVVLLPTAQTRVSVLGAENDQAVEKDHNRDREQEEAQSQFLFTLSQQLSQSQRGGSPPRQLEHQKVIASIVSLSLFFSEADEALQISKSTSRSYIEKFIKRVVRRCQRSQSASGDISSGTLTLRADDGHVIQANIPQHSTVLLRLLGASLLSDAKHSEIFETPATDLVHAILRHEVMLQWTLEPSEGDTRGDHSETFTVVSVDHFGGI